MSLTPSWLDKLAEEAMRLERETAQVYQDVPLQGTIGIKLRDDGLICAIRPGSSAETILAAGDKIQAVDGVPVDDVSFPELVELMKGYVNTTVCLDIERAGVGSMTLNVSRISLSDSIEVKETDPRRFKADPIRLKPIRCGLGFRMNLESCLVEEVSYAANFGLHTGDELLNIDGEKVTASRRDLSDALMGDEGTTADLLLKRVDHQGSYLVFMEILRKVELQRFTDQKLNQRESSRMPAYDTKPLLSLASSVGGILSGWLGKAMK
jgi:C-terminal processing protease CtpA/Prc